MAANASRKSYRGIAGLCLAALVLGGTPFSDSSDFPPNARWAMFDPSLGHSPDFALNTVLSTFDPSFAESLPFGLDTRGINRVWADSSDFVRDPEGQRLAVTPSLREVGTGAGSMSFTVFNNGARVMDWTAAVIGTDDWLRITSGLSGVNSGIIFVGFDANPYAASRTGTIRVSAPGATPSFIDVTVVQAGTEPVGQVTHFEFDPIEGPFMVNEDIPVTIRAVTTVNTASTVQAQSTFTGQVSFSTNAPCRPSPTYANMEDGFWSGVITCDQPFADTVLSAHALGAEPANSTPPFVIRSSIESTGCIRGIVLSNMGRFDPAGGSVSVKDSAGTLVAEVAIRLVSIHLPSSVYDICGLPPGTYTLRANKDGRVSYSKRARVVAGQTQTLTLRLDAPIQGPVLLVPGFPGSTVRGHFVVPTFENRNLADADDLKLLNPLIGTRRIWSKLKRTLDPHFTVIDVPWDWRDIDERRIRYLTDAIDRAKEQCDPPCDKVHIVAHSAGGILVRYYIQSDLYTERNDIERFAMCGTPNQGAPIMYYMWQGGDPRKADNIQGGLIQRQLFPFYWNTFKKLYENLRGHKPYEIVYNPLSIVLPIPPVTIVPLPASDIRVFIEHEVPTAGKLLPSYGFLDRIGMPTLQGISASGAHTPDFDDSFLWHLNNNNQFKWRIANEDNTDPNCVATQLFVSNDKETVVEIPVGSPGMDGLYWDGSPVRDPLKLPAGDGTVPYSSAVFPLAGHATIEVSEAAKHVDLMNAYASEICTFLNSGEPCGLVATADELDDEPESFLFITIEGRVQPMLISPLEQRLGIDIDTGEYVEELTDSLFESVPGRAGLSISDPLDGLYTLSLTAFPGEFLSITVDYMDANGEHNFEFQVIYHNSPIMLDILLDPEALPALALIPALEPVTNLQTQHTDGMTQVTWDAPDDPDVVAYNIYARPDDQPKYTLLGATADTAFDTGHPWNVAGSAPTWHYFVTAVAEDGTESFFTGTVENRHRLVALFSAEAVDGGEPTDPDIIGDAPVTVAFTDESLGEVWAWAWDFTGDGLIDSTEQNPEFVYTEPGNYTVVYTVGGPEGTDTAVRPGFVVVGPLPGPGIPGDFDGDGVVDLLDHAEFVERMSGPFGDPTIAGWHIFDFDFDYDVDLADWAAFQNLFDPEPK